MNRLMSMRMVPVPAKVISNVGAAAYAVATGRITLLKPCAHLLLGFSPSAPGNPMGGVRFMINAVDQETYNPNRADGGFVAGDMTNSNAKLRTNFQVAAGEAKQQWHEWNPNIQSVLTLPMFMPSLKNPMILTVDILPVDLLDGTAATDLHVYALAAE